MLEKKRSRLKEVVGKITLLSLLMSTIILLMATTFVFAHTDDSNEREIGAWGIQYYSAVGQPDIWGVAEANGFYQQVPYEANYWGLPPFIQKMFYENTGSHEDHWEKSSVGGHSSSFIDTCDIVYICQHGGTPLHILFTTNTDGNGAETWNTYPDEVSWGTGDLEWAILQCCQQLPNLSAWSSAFGGIHGICGFKTDTYAYFLGQQGSNFGTAAVSPLHNKNIGDAWKWATINVQPSDVQGSISRVRVRIDAQVVDYYTEHMGSPLPDVGELGVIYYDRVFTSWGC